MAHPKNATRTPTLHSQEQQDQLNDRAEAFSKEFAHASYEMGQAQNFVRELCGVYGLNYLRSVDFERRVAKGSGGGINRIESFSTGVYNGDGWQASHFVAGLPHLGGGKPFAGAVLSHDFVEAALMVAEGWEVWLAWDIEGTYEEGPPTLIDSAKRDRRWCQGNLQHARLVGAPEIKPWSRFVFVQGIMAYLASPLWLLFLISSIVAPLLAPEPKSAHRPTRRPARRSPLQWAARLLGFRLALPPPDAQTRAAKEECQS